MVSEAAYNCHYSIIRFSPFVETGEFANIGILLVCPEYGFLDYRVETRRLARVTRFFDPIDANFVRETIRAIDHELHRMKHSLGRVLLGQPRFKFGETDPSEILFREMARRKEGVIKFGNVRSARTNSPSNEVSRLFEFYVMKSFVSEKTREEVLETKVRDVLISQNSINKFRRVELDDGVYRKSFPFVDMRDEIACRVIKPLYLGQERSTAMIDHAWKWSMAIERFKRSKKIVGDVLFPIEGPTEGGLKHKRAYAEAKGLIHGAGIKTTPIEELDGVEEFSFNSLH